MYGYSNSNNSKNCQKLQMNPQFFYQNTQNSFEEWRSDGAITTTHSWKF